MKTATYTDLRNNLKSYLDGVVNDSDPLVIHRPKNESVVIIPLEEYNSIKETEHLMRSPVMMERLRKAEKEMNEGKGKTIPLDDLWK